MLYTQKKKNWKIYWEKLVGVTEPTLLSTLIGPYFRKKTLGTCREGRMTFLIVWKFVYGPVFGWLVGI